MKIAILTLFYNNFNYGGVLQGYALKKYINSNKGKEADLLRYKPIKNPIYPSTKEQLKQYNTGELFSKIIEKIVGKFTFLIKNKLANRNAKFKEFIDSNSNGKIYTDDNIIETNSIYDCFISGSDQVWNPNCISDGFLQKFADKEKIKGAYAASVGREKLTDREATIISSEIDNFNYVSVREECTKDILKVKTKKDISVVLDPVFLLDREQWNPKKIDFEKPYVLFYFFSDSSYIRKKVKKVLGDKMDILFIPYVKQKINFYDRKGPGKRIYDVGPDEFKDLIAGAECIFTDSFHGTAFSIIFNKPFYVFNRNKHNNQTSMNSRLINILRTFGLENRLVNIKDIPNKIDAIDYNNVNEILDNKRDESKEFLSKIIK